MTHIAQTSKLESGSANCSIETHGACVSSEATTTHSQKEIVAFRDAAAALCDPLLKVENGAYDQLIMNMITGGISPNDLIDHVIPAAAQELGEEWLSDTRSFTDVTIGTSRLQQIVRNLETSLVRENFVNIVERRALLIIPEAEQHTLGSVILANQLRRHGVRVDVVFDNKANGLSSKVSDGLYFLIGFSIGTDQSIKRASSIVTMLRDCRVKAPIALGGTALTCDPKSVVYDVGADFFAHNAREALDLCDICVSRDALLPRQAVGA